MPEETKALPEGEAQPEDQRVTLRVRDHDTKTSYANVCMLSSTAEEMILNFGLRSPVPGPERREAQMLVSNRIIMGLPAAKRLAIGLSQVIQQHENTFGVIDLRPRRARGQLGPDAVDVDEVG